MQNECWVLQSGIVAYEQAWQWQKELAERVAKGAIPPILWLLEHPHTYTIGRRGTDKHIIWSSEELACRQIVVYWVDRGGDVTYHGPGQLIGYPIFPLSQLGFTQKLPEGESAKFDAISFVEKLEQIIIRTLRQFGVSASTRSGLRGVWVPNGEKNSSNPPEDWRKIASIWRKIASIGIKLTAQGVTQHGFSLNIDPQMDYWEGIIPCGIRDCQFASLAELVQPVPKRDVFIETLIAEFGQIFQFTMVKVPQLPFDTSLESHYTIRRGG